METTRADAEDRREHRYENPGPIADYPPTLAEQLRDDVAPLIEAWTDNAGSYTCDEADHLAHLIALAIGARPAVAFLAAHCAADEALAAANPDAYAVACAVASPLDLSKEDRLFLASVVAAYRSLTDPRTVAPREKFARARRAVRSCTPPDPRCKCGPFTYAGPEPYPATVTCARCGQIVNLRPPDHTCRPDYQNGVCLDCGEPSAYPDPAP